MRAMKLLGAAAALALAPWLALAVEMELADEFALLQTRFNNSESDSETDNGPGGELPLPKLICDMDEGCRYSGLPPRHPHVPMFPSFLPSLDQEQLEKLVKGLANIKLPDLSQIGKEVAKLVQPEKQEQLEKLVKGLANIKLPDLNQIGKEVAKLVQPPGGQHKETPPTFPMPDLSELAKNIGKLLPPPPGAPPGVADILKGLAKPVLPAAEAPQTRAAAAPEPRAAAPPQQTKPHLELPDLSQIGKELAKLVPHAVAQPQQTPRPLPDLSKMAEIAAKLSKPAATPGFQMPDLAQIAQALGKLPTPPAAQPQKAPQAPQMPDLSQLAKAFGNLAAPSAPQSATQHQNAPQAPHLPDLAQIAKALGIPAAPRAPPSGASSLQRSASTGGATAFVIPDNQMWCIEGPMDYVQEKVEALKASPLGEGYAHAVARPGTCDSQSYANGPSPDKCWPKVSLYTSSFHAIDTSGEPLVMASFALRHGVAAAVKGMKELCKP